jgi:hypothetical protein
VDPTQYPFNPKAVQAIRSLAFTNTSTPNRYDFCVANLSFLTNQPPSPDQRFPRRT